MLTGPDKRTQESSSIKRIPDEKAFNRTGSVIGHFVEELKAATYKKIDFTSFPSTKKVAEEIPSPPPQPRRGDRTYVAAPPISPGAASTQLVTSHLTPFEQELKNSITLPPTPPQDRRGKRTNVAAPPISSGAASTQLVTSHKAPKSSVPPIESSMLGTGSGLGPGSVTPNLYSFQVSTLLNDHSIPKEFKTFLIKLSPNQFLHFSAPNGAPAQVSIGDAYSLGTPLILSSDVREMVSVILRGLSQATQSHQVEAPKPRVLIEVLSPDELSSVSAIVETAKVRDGVAARALKATAIVARSTARLMEKKGPTFELPAGWAANGVSPRQAIAADIMALIKQTEELATPSGPSVDKTSSMESPSTLTDAQRAHLKCAADFGKCLERYCTLDSKGSDVMFLTLTRSILGHIDQVIDTKLSAPIEVSSAAVKDSESWTVFDALQDNQPADLGLRTTPQGKTAIHAILYGGKSDVSQPQIPSNSTSVLSTNPPANSGTEMPSQHLPLENPNTIVKQGDSESTEYMNIRIVDVAHPGQPQRQPLMIKNGSVDVQSPVSNFDLRPPEPRIIENVNMNIRIVDVAHPGQPQRQPLMIKNGSVDVQSPVSNVPPVDERSTDGPQMDMDQFRTLVAVSVAVASTNNPGLGAQLPYIYDAINTVGEGPNTLQEWVDATNTYLEEDARLEVDNLRNIGDRDLEVILMSDMRPTQQHTGKELGAAHKKVAEALERYIGASKMTGVLKNLDQTIPQGSSYEETSARLEELGKPQFELLLNQKKESIPVNTKLSGEPTKHDKVAILELEKLPTNFEKAVQEALANPEISYEQIKQLLYPHSSFALQIDGNRKRTWMEYIFRW